MGSCACHPEIETNFLCMKYNKYLCEECLKCQDPNIYCKFRSACPIWFIQRHGDEWAGEEKTAAAAVRPRVLFEPDGKEIRVAAGTTLLEAAQSADVYLNASCNGKGACGKCKLVLESGQVDTMPSPLLSDGEKDKHYLLACQSRIREDIRVRIPEETIARRLQAAGMGESATAALKGLVGDIDPMLKELRLTLSPPSMDDSVSDLDRLNRGLKKEGCDVARLNVGLRVMRQLAEVVRRDNWNVTAAVIRRRCANEILEVRAGEEPEPSIGLAVDLGTTTVVVYLVDMADGTVLAATSEHNRQAACGDDVINRIVCAEKEGVKKLSRMALRTINGLVDDALESVGAEARQIKNVVVSGNTTMAHLLLQMEPRHIRRTPYIPTIAEFPIIKAGEIGLKANPIAAVFVMPGPASYVGGDIVSGLLYAGFHREDPLTLFIDVGTNGEIVLGNKDWLMTAACSAGPAFEGGGIRWGMRAEEGAIERVVIDPDTLEPDIATVNGAPPRGICGSGMIDLMSEMLKTGIIDPSGRFSHDGPHPRIVQVNGERAYVLAFADQTPMAEDLIFTESDLKNLIYSKGAVFAGFATLLSEAGLDFSMVERFIVTGGFGQYLDIDKAVGIGLLPDLERSRFTYLGNSSIVGAYMALLSGDYRQEAREVCAKMTYIDFSSNSRYMDALTSALFLPHTNLELFPSLTRPAN
jgi:uncharacterized 2Fe-2S/4Fe-4S cluster protein (DUF4445 family)